MTQNAQHWLCVLSAISYEGISLCKALLVPNVRPNFTRRTGYLKRCTRVRYFHGKFCLTSRVPCLRAFVHTTVPLLRNFTHSPAPPLFTGRISGFLQLRSSPLHGVPQPLVQQQQQQQQLCRAPKAVAKERGAAGGMPGSHCKTGRCKRMRDQGGFVLGRVTAPGGCPPGCRRQMGHTRQSPGQGAHNTQASGFHASNQVARQRAYMVVLIMATTGTVVCVKTTPPSGVRIPHDACKTRTRKQQRVDRVQCLTGLAWHD